MAVELLEAFATDFLEHKDLLGLDVVTEDGGFYYSTLDIRGTDFDCTLSVDEEHLVELDGLVGLRGQAVDEDLGTSFYFKLLAGNVYDCVHYLLNS